MPYIETAEEAQADGPLAELFALERRAWGYLPNLARTIGVRPDVYRAWRSLNGAIKATMTPQRYELATLAAAVELRSTYCALAHGRTLAGLMPEEHVIGVATGRAADDLEPADLAIVAFARRIARDASRVGREDVATLRDVGLGDDEIFDVIAAVAARCFFSTVLDATGTEADAAFAELPEPLRDALTVGRPIADPQPA
jgi:uncharacterized peroxidase-related enzyme